MNIVGGDPCTTCGHAEFLHSDSEGGKDFSCKEEDCLCKAFAWAGMN